jgi:hypothetical protein
MAGMVNQRGRERFCGGATFAEHTGIRRQLNVILSPEAKDPPAKPLLAA